MHWCFHRSILFCFLWKLLCCEVVYVPLIIEPLEVLLSSYWHSFEHLSPPNNSKRLRAKLLLNLTLLLSWLLLSVSVAGSVLLADTIIPNFLSTNLPFPLVLLIRNSIQHVVATRGDVHHRKLPWHRCSIVLKSIPETFIERKASISVKV